MTFGSIRGRLSGVSAIGFHRQGRNHAMLNVAKHDFKSQEDRCDVVAFGLQIF
jgi:hypothetical protein